MEEKGKVHRHVKLRKIEQAHDPNLKELMGRALCAAEEGIQGEA